MRRAPWRRVFGVATRSGTPEALLASWQEVAEITGASLPERLTHLPDSLVLSRAARAAEHQGRARAEAALVRLRESVFVDGDPADSPARLRAVLAGTLDVERLIRDLDSPDVVWSVDADRAEARRPRPGAETRLDGGVARYAFPTLVVGDRVLSGWHALAVAA